MTITFGRPEFKTCPNCGGDGYEDNPPMRRCGVCKGAGHLPYKGTTKHRRATANAALAPVHGRRTPICPSHQGRS